MRVCIVGAGAIGCFVGARLAKAGVAVTLVARGAQLRALQGAGLRLVERDASESVLRLRAVERIAEAGPQELVILAVKAHQVAPIAAQVAQVLGAGFRVPLEKRIEGASRVGHHRTSMLQDVESGRATELDALLGSVIELARFTGTPVPHLEAVYACAALLERTVCRPRTAQPAPVAQKAA